MEQAGERWRFREGWGGGGGRQMEKGGQRGDCRFSDAEDGRIEGESGRKEAVAEEGERERWTGRVSLGNVKDGWRE